MSRIYYNDLSDFKEFLVKTGTPFYLKDANTKNTYFGYANYPGSFSNPQVGFVDIENVICRSGTSVKKTMFKLIRGRGSTKQNYRIVAAEEPTQMYYEEGCKCDTTSKGYLFIRWNTGTYLYWSTDGKNDWSGNDYLLDWNFILSPDSTTTNIKICLWCSYGGLIKDRSFSCSFTEVKTTPGQGCVSDAIQFNILPIKNSWREQIGSYNAYIFRSITGYNCEHKNICLSEDKEGIIPTICKENQNLWNNQVCKYFYPAKEASTNPSVSEIWDKVCTTSINVNDPMCKCISKEGIDKLFNEKYIGNYNTAIDAIKKAYDIRISEEKDPNKKQLLIQERNKNINDIEKEKERLYRLYISGSNIQKICYLPDKCGPNNTEGNPVTKTSKCEVEKVEINFQSCIQQQINKIKESGGSFFDLSQKCYIEKEKEKEESKSYTWLIIIVIIIFLLIVVIVIGYIMLKMVK